MTDNMDRYLDGFELHYRSLRSGCPLNGDIGGKKATKIYGGSMMWGKKIIHKTNGEMRDTLPDSHTAS